jgi:hypothetical protein
VQIAGTSSKEMKIARLPLILFLFMILPAAYSQQNGIVEGRLLNRTDSAITTPNVELEVIELSAGMSIVRVETTDSRGRFRIEGLPQGRRLMIRANYKGANYHSLVNFDDSGRAVVDIEVFEPTTSMKDIKVAGVQIAFQAVGDQLRSMETVTINNNTNPPMTFINPEGAFRVSKPTGILEPPQIRVTAPGSSMPLVQTALESPDGQSYYSLYPLRPGTTVFEVQQLLPYANRSYRYVKKFYLDMGPIDIGVLPQDMALSGKDIAKIQTDSVNNIAVYVSPAVKAGSEVTWLFSGGTPVSEGASSETAGDSVVTEMPNFVGRNVTIIGPLLLLGFVLVLWYAFNHPERMKH